MSQHIEQAMAPHGSLYGAEYRDRWSHHRQSRRGHCSSATVNRSVLNR